MRRPGCSAAVTASAVLRRSSRSGEAEAPERDVERDRPSSASSTSIAEVCSVNSRAHALAPVTCFSARIRSSGSESR